MIEAPDLIEPVVGFRDWRAVDGKLISRHLPFEWSARTMRAECYRGGGFAFASDVSAAVHRAPGRDCRCGIYAYYRPEGEFPIVDARGVTGIVTVWGEIEAHADGLRAEYARVEALGVYQHWTRRRKLEVAAIAELLDVELVDQRELERAASSYGSAIPQDLLPSGRE
jgi:hypothetical protein